MCNHAIGLGSEADQKRGPLPEDGLDSSPLRPAWNWVGNTCPTNRTDFEGQCPDGLELRGPSPGRPGAPAKHAPKRAAIARTAWSFSFSCRMASRTEDAAALDNPAALPEPSPNRRELVGLVGVAVEFS